MHFTFDTFLALVAIAMTMPPLLALFWGRPQPVAEFTAAPDGSILFCHIDHSPIGRIGRRIGIRREIEHVTAMFSVLSLSTHQTVGEPTHAIFMLGANLEESINGRLGFENPLMFKIAQYSGESAEISRRGAWDSAVKLPHGRYRCEITLSFPERNMTKLFCKNFIAGRPSEMKWLD
jgi:hypothetical protein